MYHKWKSSSFRTLSENLGTCHSQNLSRIREINMYGFDTDLTELDTTTILGERRLSQSGRDLLLGVSSFFANFACVSWKCVWLGCGWPVKFLTLKLSVWKSGFLLIFIGRTGLSVCRQGNRRPVIGLEQYVLCVYEAARMYTRHKNGRVGSSCFFFCLF